MPMKTLLAASIFVLLPLAAQAQCMWGDYDAEASISCAPGTTWDAAEMACVASVSS